MIIDNTKTSDVQLYGDIQEYKASIDPKNLEFIVTLLSSNLYSAPEQSFIREIVSNAWDSHVEAGNTDTPVIIKFTRESPTTDNRYTPDYYLGGTISIRDFGTGISPERFEEIYCNIGSSTKRNSNEYIGAFGIGRFSALACSNTVDIVSYYNGIAYHYVMIKDGNDITINKILEMETEEKNGVLVSITVDKLTAYRDAIKHIIFFPNVYIDDFFNKDFNNIKIKRFNNFAYATTRLSDKLLLGNVLYPIDYKHFSGEIKGILDRWEPSGIAFSFDIGEIGVTPNRESIIYSRDTIEVISQRIKDANDELIGILNKRYSRDYDDIVKYTSVLSDVVTFSPLENNNTREGTILISIKELSDLIEVKFKGKKRSNEFISVAKMLCGRVMPTLKGIVIDDKVYSYNTPMMYSNYTSVSSLYNIIIPKGTRLTSAIKEFLIDSYPSHVIIYDFTKEEFRTLMLCNYDNGPILVSDNPLAEFESVDDIIDSLYDRITSNATRIDFDTNKEFKEFKNNHIPEKVIVDKLPIIYDCRLNDYNEVSSIKRTFSTLDALVKHLKTDPNCGVILIGMKDDAQFFCRIAEVKNMLVVRARKDILEYLRSLNLSCIVDIHWILHDDPLLSKIKTVYENVTTIVSMNDIYNILPRDLHNIFGEVMDYFRMAYEHRHYRDLAVQNGKIDKSLLDNTKLFNEYIEKAKLVTKIRTECDLNGLGYYAGETMLAAIVMKHKIFRINKKYYNRVKNNKLIKALCGRLSKQDLEL